MRIERLDPANEPEQADACYRILCAAQAADDPDGPQLSRRMFGGWLKNDWVGDPREAWLAAAEDDDGVLGWYLLDLPVRDNRHRAGCQVLVRQDRQRRGTGSALLRHAAERALADDRGVLNSFVRDGSSGEAFARACGATGGIAQIRRLLDLGAVPAGRLGELRAAAQPAAAGYRVVSWTGPTPEEYLDQVAAVNNAIADAPRDPGWQPPSWDASRVRGSDRRARRCGLRWYTVAAWHDEAAELAGLTQVDVDPETPGWGHQELTAVARAHRGHRLGLLLKIEMMELLAEAEPQIRRIITGNAEGNEHMIAINEALGYRVFGPPFRSWDVAAKDVVEP